MMRKWVALAALAGMAVLMMGASPTQQTTLYGEHITYTLFAGENVDSTEQASAWIPVGGARRVVIRTWSAKAAFHASTDADSTYSDSLITFKLAFSDSLQATDPATAADSILIDPAVTAADSAKSMIQVKGLPINKELRGPGNGSGLITVVGPISVGLLTSDPSIGIIPKRFMRVRVTPLRRMTVTGSQSTAGIRVNGLKGLRMWATVIR